ncbi:MAG TPA: hypothetical protein DEA67_03750 [Selenomonas sp.]|nr:hypothetical protein [Selenomonas sp.]
MAKRHKSQEHIRAARDWLGDAEDSLAQADDVRSDLKVMLAKAELAQVQAGPHTRRLQRWLRCLLPPAVAVLLVAAGCWGWQAYTSAPRQESAETTAVSVQPAPVPQPAGHDEAPTAMETEEPSPAAMTADAEPSKEAVPAPAQVVQPAPATVPQATARPAVQQARAQTQPPATVPPDAQKQRLMQAAGQSLRAP